MQQSQNDSSKASDTIDYSRLKTNFDFKKLILEVLESRKEVKSLDGNDITRDRNFTNVIAPLFTKTESETYQLTLEGIKILSEETIA